MRFLRSSLYPSAREIDRYWFPLKLIRGLAEGATLAEVARSFRRQKAVAVSDGLTRKSIGKRAASGQLGNVKKNKSNLVDAISIEVELLAEYGFDKELSQHALACCSNDVGQAVEFCLAHTADDGEGSPSFRTLVDETKQHLLASTLLRNSCFRLPPTNEHVDANTVATLLAATDVKASQPWRARAASLCKRRLANRVASCAGPKGALVAEYKQRAMERWPEKDWAVLDLGIKAGPHTNACFWLCLAAGWSRCAPKAYVSVELLRLHEQARCLTPSDLETPRRSASDAVGIVADGLRQYFCGPTGIMLNPEVMAVYAPIFAACNDVYGDNTRPANLEAYRQWIAKVARVEFADELILAAAAKFLKVCITTVPHTPAGDDAWVIAQHPESDGWAAESITEEIVMGNNDVHYVWLCEGAE